MLNQIYFVTNETKLKEMVYSDSIYAWLLLYSHYSPDEEHNYIYRKDFTYEQIGKALGKTRQTVSKRLAKLIEDEKNSPRPLIYESPDKKILYFPCFREFQKLDKPTVLNLFRLCSLAPRREELIKTYAWLRKKNDEGKKEFSLNDLIEVFGHSKGNEQTYDRYKDILTTLQGAGLIKFRTDTIQNRTKKGEFSKTLYIYQVNKSASKEWLDKEGEIL